VSFSRSELIGECLAEVLGTFVIILLGDGIGAASVCLGAYDPVGVALVWGVAVMTAVYITGGVSGAHLNPAVTLAVALFRKFPRWKIVPFVISQTVGAFLAAATLFWCWRGFWLPAANKLGVSVGQPGSQKLMMIFCCYYPNPSSVGIGPQDLAKVSTATAFITEAVMTLLLLLAILALGDERNPQSPKSNLAPMFIGLVVSALVMFGGPLTMAALNPARDFGPRLFGYLAGWGSIALPGPRGSEWWVYILAPLVGGLLGGAVYSGIVQRSFPKLKVWEAQDQSGGLRALEETGEKVG
jgi:glycerol uptake facilitator protein